MPKTSDRPQSSTDFQRAAATKHAKVIADRTHYLGCSVCFQLCRLGRPCLCETHLEVTPQRRA